MFIELSGNLSIKLNALGQIHNQLSLKHLTIVLSQASAVLNEICFKKATELIHYKHLLEQSFDCICVFTIQFQPI